jgi:putative membrane protein
MHAGTRYSLKEMMYWTRRDIYILVILSVFYTIVYEFLGFKWIAIPWVPIALVGTAAAFLIGFRNTQTYNRVWEARQIWGSIINSSRSWAILVKDFTGNNANAKAIHTELYYRHIAWLTALRFQLREPRAWENIHTKISNKEYSRHYKVEEWINKIEESLQPFLSAEELDYVLSKKNRATHIIGLQSSHLKRLRDSGELSELNHIEMENMLVNLFEQQGKCERIKNFPYPRQFATTNQMFTRLFIFLIPLGTLNEFQKLTTTNGHWIIWLTIPFSAMISWVFMAMEKIGESTENPFEGGANDVPITALSRTIEIDLREMLDETELPPALTPVNKILM